MNVADPLIAIAICTLERPHGLTTLLDAIDRQRLGAWPDEAVALVIVDNSPSGSVAALCAARAEAGRFRLHYVHETRRGLSFARNAALAASQAIGARRIAFLDDDEMPDPGWLVALDARLEATAAAAAIGPVRPLFEAPPPLWAVAGGFYAKVLNERAGALEDAYTCNALIDIDFLTRHGLVFEDRFNSTGGEDTIFFRALRAAGGRAVWAADAVVHEHMASKRMTRAWMLKRWFRTGGTEAELGRGDAGSPLGRCNNALRGAARIAGGSCRFVFALLASPRRAERHMAALYTLCRGAGLIASAMGRTYAEYASPAYRRGCPGPSHAPLPSVGASPLESPCNSHSS